MKKIVIADESHLDLYRRWGKLSKPYFKWQFSHFSKYVGQRIGDIGCGLGNFVFLFSELPREPVRSLFLLGRFDAEFILVR